MVNYISNAIRAYVICLCYLNWSCVFSNELKEIYDDEYNKGNKESDKTFYSDVKNRLENVQDLDDLKFASQDFRNKAAVSHKEESGLLPIEFQNDILSDKLLRRRRKRKADKQNGLMLRRKRFAEEENLCDRVCSCRYENNFSTVDCTLKQQSVVLQPNKFFPNYTTSININLSQNAVLRIDANMFAKNRINRISIRGSHPKGQEHLEIGPNAFKENRGPFPEIEIANIHTVLLQSNAFYHEFKLNVVNCSKVLIFSEAFVNTTFNGYFDNINNLIIFERAFAKSEAKIYINKCYIEQLQRLEATLKELKFTESHIHEISTGAFDVISINSIIFENCKIDTIEKNAVTEKLFSNNLAIIGCNIATIQTGSIAGSGITDVLFLNNSIDTIKEKAMALMSVNVLISNNTINYLERFWIRIDEWSNVTVTNNRFGEYNQMGVESTPKPAHCLFENNFITIPKLGSLNFKSPHCRIKQISFNQPCACNASLFKQLSLSDLRTEYFCTIDSTLAHCFNATLFNVLDYERKICDDSTKIDCIMTNVNIKRDGSFINLKDLIRDSKKIFYICLVIGFIVALIVITSLFYSIKCYMRKEVVNAPTRDMIIMASLHPPTPKKPQMFSRSDLMIIQETLDTMRVKYPPEVYDQVHNNTRKLIDGDMTESEKVLIIGEIVKNLVDCQDMGTDFVAFTDILYNHLEPSQGIYFEPDEPLNMPGNGLYAISGNPGNGQGDPIYAEPSHVQQPLLKNEYMQPVDLDGDNALPLYSEPIFDSSAKDFIVTKDSARRAYPPQTDKVEVCYSQVRKPSAAPVPSTSKQSSTDHHQLPKNTSSNKRTNLRDTRYKSSSESNSLSDHSGGSGDTLQIEDIYEYTKK